MHSEYFNTQFCCVRSMPAWPPQFAIISAYAATGQVWTAERNKKADADLKGLLRNTRKWRRRIIGYSPQTGHAEPSWAIQTDWEEACNIGHLFQQDAIYFVDGDELYVSHCDTRRKLHYVGSFRERTGRNVAKSKTSSLVERLANKYGGHIPAALLTKLLTQRQPAPGRLTNAVILSVLVVKNWPVIIAEDHLHLPAQLRFLLWVFEGQNEAVWAGLENAGSAELLAAQKIQAFIDQARAELEARGQGMGGATGRGIRSGINRKWVSLSRTDLARSNKAIPAPNALDACQFGKVRVSDDHQELDAREFFALVAMPNERFDENWADDIWGLIVEQGILVGQQRWDSGGAGAGAGTLDVYLFRGIFVASNDVGTYGPFKTFQEAAHAVGLFKRTDATVDIWVRKPWSPRQSQ